MRREGTSSSRSASATARAISSWMAKVPASSRSNVCDQRWVPSPASMSCAVARRWLPSLRTLPSSTAEVLSAAAMARRSSLLPLKAKEEVRPTTLRARTRVSALRSSSAMPSEK